MALQNFVDKVTTVATSWLNSVDILLDTVFGSATTKAAARVALFPTPTDNGVIVGNGTDWATESGMTLLESLGLPEYMGAMGIPLNFELSPSVASNALTMAVKTAAGTDPSATDKVRVPFRSSTATSGAITWRTITSALSTVISSGSTGGHNSGLKQYIYWYLIDNAGTVELAWSSKFFGMSGIVTTTAEGGAGAADSGTTMYSTTARTSVPFTCVAYTEDTQTTAGTWAATPSNIYYAPFSHPVISFSAVKSADQATVATGTKITFPTENYDNGGLFDATTNYRFTPPPGRVEIKAGLRIGGTLVDQNSYGIYVQKNGTDRQSSQQHTSGTTQEFAVIVAFDDECNGTDYYEVVLKHSSASNPTIIGTGTGTFFHGSWSPGRS